MTNCIGCEEAFTTIDSPSFILKRVAPSRLTQAAVLPSKGLKSLILEEVDKIKGRKEGLCGVNGVRLMQGALLWTILPPADKL